jgi:hypothetical protein
MFLFLKSIVTWLIIKIWIKFILEHKCNAGSLEAGAEVQFINITTTTIIIIINNNNNNTNTKQELCTEHNQYWLTTEVADGYMKGE